MQRTHLIIIVLFVFFIGCNQVTKKQKNAKKNVFLQKIDRPFVAGNFDKKGINDTIFFHYYSNSSKTEINEIPSSLNNDRDDIVSWFTQFQVDSYLTYKKDTLFIGFAYGFSCFFNIGDTNSDGKDEVAFVVDWLDYSNINSCQIYSMCNNQWELLKEFTIHESAFELPISDTVSSFSCIPGYLEKRNDIWMYKEYDVKKENDNSMKVLHLNKCNNLTSGLVIEKLVELLKARAAIVLIGKERNSDVKSITNNYRTNADKILGYAHRILNLFGQYSVDLKFNQAGALIKTVQSSWTTFPQLKR